MTEYCCDRGFRLRSISLAFALSGDLGDFCKRISRQQGRFVMPMKMGIHRKPIGLSYPTFLDSRMRGNDRSMFFFRKRLSFLWDGNLARLDGRYSNGTEISSSP